MADVAIDTDVASRFQKGTEPAWVRDHIIGARTWLTFGDCPLIRRTLAVWPGNAERVP